MAPKHLEILAYEDTPLGPLCLRRRPAPGAPEGKVVEITLNHEFLMSSLHTASERTLASGAVEFHGGDALHVRVGGLGLGYTAAAALDSERVRRVEVVELLPQVIDWMAAGMLPLSARLEQDSRFRVVRGDAYAMLAAPPEGHWDVILIDVDHSPAERLGDSGGDFYTDSGLRAAASHLSEGGVLGVWSYARDTPFADALQNSFADVRVTPVTFRNVHLDSEQTDWLFFARGLREV